MGRGKRLAWKEPNDRRPTRLSIRDESSPISFGDSCRRFRGSRPKSTCRYSRAALDAALRGPTSPLELAERASTASRKVHQRETSRRRPQRLWGSSWPRSSPRCCGARVRSPTPTCGSALPLRHRAVPSPVGRPRLPAHGPANGGLSELHSSGFWRRPMKLSPRNRPRQVVASGLRQQEGVHRPDRADCARQTETANAILHRFFGARDGERRVDAPRGRGGAGEDLRGSGGRGLDAGRDSPGRSPGRASRRTSPWCSS